MKIVVAPNALKGALSAEQAAHAIAAGLRRAQPELELALLPIADGGDGSAEVLVRALKGDLRSAPAHDALGRPIEASYGLLPGERAVIDVASASGLGRLAHDERDVFFASSFGTGELVHAALAAGAREIILGVGGSACVDGGLGLLKALGVRPLDAAGHELLPNARSLPELARLDTSALIASARSARWTILCDVDVELAGAIEFAPQKGARSEDLPEIERGLRRLGGVLGAGAAFAGAGAAGGIPASLCAVLGAQAVRGIDFVLDAIGFDAALVGASLVVSAEGRFDAQSALNKGPVGVARRARVHGVPTLVLAGAVAEFAAMNSDVAAVLSITREPCELKDAQTLACAWLSLTAEQALRVFVLGRAAAAAP
ncbi:MAG: glycerate kinase [Myxococcota bacterium]